MNELTPEEIAAKISQVQADISELHNNGIGGRKLEVLSEYQEYLKEQLKDQNDQKTKT
jgi:hypothetical protein